MGHQEGRHIDRGAPHAGEGTDFVLEISREGETERIAVHGWLDAARAPALEQAIRNAESRSARLIVVDLTDVTSIDRPGLAALLKSRVRLRNFGDSFSSSGRATKR